MGANMCGSTDNKYELTNRQIVVDTDVGLDDLFALTMLLGSPYGNQIKLITTVHGMTDPVLGARTVRRLLARFGREQDVVVVAGGEYVEEDGMHTLAAYDWGRDYLRVYGSKIEQLGLPPGVVDESERESSAPPSKARAANALVASFSKGQPTTLLCLGPLTNIAAAIPELLEVYPKHFDLVVMGGAVHCNGNMGPNDEAETNFFCDPRSAHDVFAAAGRIFKSVRLGDLNTANETHCDRINAFVREREGTAGTDGPVVASLFAALASVEPTSSGYDPITTAFLLDPAALSTSPHNIVVDAVTGVSSSVGSEYPDAAAISLATKLNIGTFLNILQGLY